MKAAKIISMAEFAHHRCCSTSVVVSGGFDPLHPGHASYLAAAADLADLVVAVVNGDGVLARKKGYSFMPLADRCRVVSCIRGVDFVVPFEPTDPEDLTVNEALVALQPEIFAKGGDRNAGNIPETETCQANAIKIVNWVGWVGWDKEWSSSDYLTKWDNRKSIWRKIWDSF